MEWLSLVLLGFGTGVYGVLVGAGGGFIIGPVFLIFFNMEPPTVAGTALALVAANSIAGSVTYRRMGLVDMRSGILFAVAALPGSVLAPFTLAVVNVSTFRILFGLLLIALAIQMTIRMPVKETTTQARSPIERLTKSRHIITGAGHEFKYEFNEGLATASNLFLGFISSFFGMGGGFLRTPLLVYAFSFPVRVAVATSIFTLSISATAGAIAHAYLGHVDWTPTFLWVGIGLTAGGQIGARLGGVVKGVWILRLLLVVVLLLGIKLLTDGLLS